MNDGKQYKCALRIFVINIFILCWCPLFSQQKAIDSLLNVLKKHSLDDSSRVHVLISLSSNYQASNLKLSENYAAEAVDLAKEINSDAALCAALSQLGSVYTWERLSAKALEVLGSELDLAEKMKSDEWLQDAYLGIGYVYELENDWNKALAYSLKAIPYTQKMKEPFYLAYAYDHLGSQYLGIRNNDKAAFYLQRAAAIFHENGYSDQYADCHINLGKVFAARKQYDSAINHFNVAIKTFEDIDEPYQVADASQAAGDMYVQMGDYTKAKQFYLNTIKNYNKNDVSEADFALAVMGLGVVALSEKKFDSASAIFHTEFEKVKKANIIDQELTYLRYMAKADSSLGKYQEALRHMQDYASLYDSFYNDRKLRNSEMMTAEFDVQQKEKENEQLRIQYDLKKQQVTIFAIMGIVLFIAGIFLALLYKQKTSALKSLNESQAATETKNKELAVINAIKDKLISMIAHDVRAPLTSLQNTLYVTREKIISYEEFERLSSMLDNDIRHLIGMLDNTLLWAREQINVLNVEKVPFSLFNLTNDVLALYNQSILEKKLHVENKIPEDLQVVTDREIIHAVMRNMVSNAIKFTGAGKHIEIFAEKQQEQVLVHIKDEGTGISYGILEKLTKKEFISTRGTNNEKGTGLGLMFSYDLLAKLNESLTIRTEPGEGTTVIFSISNPELQSAS